MIAPAAAAAAALLALRGAPADTLPPAPVAGAEDSAGAARWRLALTGGFETFASQRTTWQAYDARLERHDGRGSLAAEAVLARRFSLWDAGGAVDLYRVLWPGAYGNLRIVAAPGARVIPRLDAAAELFQGVGAGWEVSAGYRRMTFLGASADLWSASAAKYIGPWYARVRAMAVPRSGALGGSLGLLVRRYLRRADDLVELSGAAGKEVVMIGVGPQFEIRSTKEAALRVLRFVSPVLGISVSATYAAEEGIPTRAGATVGIVRRL